MQIIEFQMKSGREHFLNIIEIIIKNLKYKYCIITKIIFQPDHMQPI